MRPKKQPKAWTRYPFLVGFALFLWGFSLLDLLTPAREHSEMENRYLAQAPQLSWRQLVSNIYTLRYEEAVNDQFLLRDGWITLKSLAETALGKMENNGVLYGADGYLFEKAASVDEGQLQKNIEFMAGFAALYSDLPVTVSIIPNSYAILADKLPAGFEAVDQLGMIEAYYENLSAAGARVLDLAPALLAHRDEALYYRTDHHWTTAGAYLAYREYARSLGLEPAGLDNLAAHEAAGFYGTYYSKAKPWNARPDTITWYDIPVSEVEVDGQTAQGLYDLAQFQQRDKYAAFLHSNNALTVLRGGAGEPGSRVLLVKDSYGNCFAPFLLGSFEQVYVVDLRYYNDLHQLLAQTAFDDVYILYNFSTLTIDLSLYKLTYTE